MTKLNWKLVLVRLEIVLILTQDRCVLCVERTIGLKIILSHPMDLLGDVGMWNLSSFRLETVLVSVQDRCMVCARCTKAYISFWMHPMVPLGDEAQVEAPFSLFGDIANLDAR